MAKRRVVEPAASVGTTLDELNGKKPDGHRPNESLRA